LETIDSFVANNIVGTLISVNHPVYVKNKSTY